MSDFRQLSDRVLASPQIMPSDLGVAASMGVTLVINNRPDGEAPDQPAGADIEQAARAVGLDYLAIPIGQAGFALPQVQAMQSALATRTAGCWPFAGQEHARPSCGRWRKRIQAYRPKPLPKLPAQRGMMSARSCRCCKRSPSSRRTDLAALLAVIERRRTIAEQRFIHIAGAA